jgi:PleD family two-component response regulator
MMASASDLRIATRSGDSIEDTFSRVARQLPTMGYHPRAIHSLTRIRPRGGLSEGSRIPKGEARMAEALIVENDAAARQALRLVLTEAGYLTQEAEDGLDGLQIL